jgi:hypothetical protein
MVSRTMRLRSVLPGQRVLLAQRVRLTLLLVLVALVLAMAQSGLWLLILERSPLAVVGVEGLLASRRMHKCVLVN